MKPALPLITLPSPLPSALTRRQWLAGMAGAAWMASSGLQLAHGLPLQPRQFPRDFGSHPDLRTEWWYITGHAHSEGRLFGFQITFFRSRVDSTQGLQSALAAKQLLFAHAALCDLQGRHLYHDQRMAREGMGWAEACTSDTAVKIGPWQLARSPHAAPDATAGQNTAAPSGSRYHALIDAREFALDLICDTTQPVLLQGQQGLSRKGPEVAQASYYYSQPQLQVSGQIRLNGKRFELSSPTPAEPVTHHNRAWLDHEVSEALMHPDAVGWDWLGMNLWDGSALTAFRLRRADGSSLWSSGSWRPAGQSSAQVFAPGSVQWSPLRHWRSPSSQASYPVDWRVTTPMGVFDTQALLDNQELDSRGSTGAIYWEGLSDLRSATGKTIGRGYVEMTGYAQALKL